MSVQANDPVPRGPRLRDEQGVVALLMIRSIIRTPCPLGGVRARCAARERPALEPRTSREHDPWHPSEGAEIVQVSRVFGRRFESVYEVTSYLPPRRVTYSAGRAHRRPGDDGVLLEAERNPRSMDCGGRLPQIPPRRGCAARARRASGDEGLPAEAGRARRGDSCTCPGCLRPRPISGSPLLPTGRPNAL
jgi:hypothetical protein